MNKVLVIKGNWQENQFMVEFVNLLARHGISYHCVVNDEKSETVLYVKKEGFNAHKLEVRETLKETMNLFKFIDGKLNALNNVSRSEVITSQSIS